MVALDGFALNASIVDQAGHWPYLAVERLRDVVGGDVSRWRPRQYVVPPAGVAIGARADYIEQLAIVPGSLLWGISFAALTGTVADFQLQVLCDYDGSALSSRPIAASAFAPAGAIRPVVMAEPKRIAGATVSVRLWNLAASDRVAQLVLCCAEPWGSAQ